MTRSGWFGLGGLVLLLPTGLAAHQTVEDRQIRGVVIDAASGSPVPNASLVTRPSNRRSGSDSSGQFTIVLSTGDTLIARAEGYRPSRRVVGLSETVVRIGLSPAASHLDELVVTASRRTQRASESAVAVARISGVEIESAAAMSLDHAIANLPGLAVLPNTPTGANLAIRGIDGARVLVLIDGEPAVGAMLENRDLSRISTVAADHVEVVKGPMSALYGSDAIGGVVNVVTRDPAGPLTLDGRMHIGSLGRRDAQLTTQAGGPIAFRVTGAWREQARVASANWADDALSRVWDLRATARINATPHLAIRTDASILRERQRWRVSVDGFNGFNDNIGATGWTELRWQRGAHILRSRFYLERYEHLFRQAQSARPLAIDTTPAQTEWMAKASLGWSGLLAEQRWDAGIDLSHRAIESPGKIAGPVSDDAAEGYAQASITSGKLLITPAARLSWNSRWGTAVTPSLAAAWTTSDQVRLRGSVGRGYRGPSFKELLWDFPNPTAGYLLAGNPDLLPERSWQIAAGVTWAMGGGVSVDAEAYHNELRDLIELADFGFDPPSGLVRYSARNVSRAMTRGVEVGIRWSQRTIDLTLGYNLLDSEDRSTGESLARRARHSGRARAAWTSRADRFGLTATVAFTGPAPFRQLDGSPAEQAAFVSADAQGRVDLSRQLGLMVGIDNIFDARPSNWVGTYGRRVYAGVRAGWTP